MTSAYQRSIEIGKTESPIEIDDRIQILFAALGQTFNEKFTGRFPTTEIRQTGKAYWQEQLKDLTDMQLAEGIKACFEWKENMAPNLNEFRRLCLRGSEPKPPAPQLCIAPPWPQRTSEQQQLGEMHLEKMRELIKKGKTK